MAHSSPSEEIAEDLLTSLMNDFLAKKRSLIEPPKEYQVELLKAHWLHRVAVEISLLNNTLEGIRMKMP